VVICLERVADLHMAQLMPLPLTVSCFSKIQIGFTFLVPSHPGSPGQRAAKQMCVCVCLSIKKRDCTWLSWYSKCAVHVFCDLQHCIYMIVCMSVASMNPCRKLLSPFLADPNTSHLPPVFHLNNVYTTKSLMKPGTLL